jgi:hypothetical protein
MKKNVIPALLAAVFCLFLASCNRGGLTPENPGSEEESQPSPEARFWDVVGNLVSMKDFTMDFQGKTFQPTIGDPEGGDASIRAVLVGSLEEAVEKFNAMTGSSINENTTAYTYKDAVVGQMTWNKGDGSTCWATVDVSIPTVPSLRQIIYRSPEQGDVNGDVGNNGSAYYRFGDIIKRTRPEDGVEEYWICVRPAFGPEGKGNSHWISVSPLPETHIWPYNSTKEEQAHKPHTASNKMNYGLPVGLKDGTEYMQYLAEMLYAIYYPGQWFENITNFSGESTFGSPTGLLIFTKFHKSNIQYHNVAFWTNVQNAWKQKGIARKVFGLSDQEICDALTSEGGLHFIYKSYEWNTTLSNKASLYQAQYQLTTSDNKKRNMRMQTTKKVTHQVVVPKTYTQSSTNFPFDIKTETSTSTPYIVKPEFFGDNAPRWIVRFAEGEELAANGAWDPQQPISGFEKNKNGEVYRYYDDVFPDKNLTDAPEISEYRRGIVNDPASWDKSEYSGAHHYELGDVLRDENSHTWFVVGISGAEEKSPYAELVCLDGIETASASAVAKNIVTKEKAERAAAQLWFLFRKNTRDGGETIRNIVSNISDQAKVNIGKLAWEHVPKNNNDKIVPADQFSVAYFEEGSTKQHLLRFIAVTGVSEDDIYSVLWTRYPSSAVTDIEKYSTLTTGSFSNVDIYLQDVAEQSKVNSYANDILAKSALFEGTKDMKVRTTTESKASSVSNYFYDFTKWNAGTQPFGMWNEPVLFLRSAILYDRGGEYSTKTADGVALTMVNKVNVNSDTQAWTRPFWSLQKGAYRKVNGEQVALPSWQSVWGNK